MILVQESPVQSKGWKGEQEAGDRQMQDRLPAA